MARISLMGGSIGLGNTTPAAEFNVYVDPEAAREVFESGLPITMSGLDVTHRAGAGPPERESLRSLGRHGGVVAELLEFFAATYERIYGFDAPPLHDAVAVAAVMEPELLETRPMRVEVECERVDPRRDRLRLLRRHGQTSQRRGRGGAGQDEILRAPVPVPGTPLGGALREAPLREAPREAPTDAPGAASGPRSRP